MKRWLNGLHILVFPFLFVLCCDKNPQSTPGYTPAAEIPEGNFIAATYNYFSNPDTLFIMAPKCDCVKDSIVQNISVNAYPIKMTRDSLILRVITVDSLGTGKKQRVELFEGYLRAAEGDGIIGKWKLDGRWFQTETELTNADSAWIANNFDKARAWLSISQTQMAIYSWADLAPHYYSTFINKYGGAIGQYDVRIDSLGPEALRLIGKISSDTVFASKDSLGIVSFSVVIKSSEDSAVFTPNPFLFNPTSVPVNDRNGACREYPEWLKTFLNTNRRSATL